MPHKISKWDGVLIQRSKTLQKPERNWSKFIKTVKQKNLTILDLGCGFGRNSIFLTKKNYQLYCLDKSKKGLQLLKNKAKNINAKINIKQGNIYHPLPYKDNFFDIIVSIHVIHHSEPRNIKKLIRDLERILKPKGYLFITVAKNNTQNIASKLKKIGERTYVPIDGSEKNIPHFMFNKKLLTAFFKDFKIIKLGSDKELYGSYYILIAQKK